jgi:hypothetical protein
MTRMTMMVAVAALAANTAWAADLPATLVNPYLEVQAALAADRVDGLGPHAQSIAAAATALGPGAEKIAAGAKKLAEAKDLAAARTAFGDLSVAIADYAQATKSGFGADVKLAYCPMANKPWLQRDKNIRNPYYGAAMLTCGSFK